MEKTDASENDDIQILKFIVPQSKLLVKDIHIAYIFSLPSPIFF